MPAATIAALLDYETNIEDALKAHFQNTLPTTQILTPRVLIGTAPILTTPRITLVVGVTGTNANQTATRANTSQDYDSHKLGTVQAIGTVRRDGTGQSLGTIRGNIRQAMLQATAAPAQVAQLLEALRTELDGAPRTVDVGTWVGNLTGPTLEGDDRRALLPLAAARIGELTYSLSRQDNGLRIQGKSDGGVFLPLFTLWLAATGPGATTVTDALARWRLRAFGSRDGDRAEAVRQLQRAGAQGLDGMRAMLHGDEACRLAAVDGLIRLRAAGELPQIVAAADGTSPLVTDAAALADRKSTRLNSSHRT